jgi:hypothetical protein
LSATPPELPPSNIRSPFLHLLAPAHAGSLKDAQDDIKAFRKDKSTFTPRPTFTPQPDELADKGGRWIVTVK